MVLNILIIWTSVPNTFFLLLWTLQLYSKSVIQRYDFVFFYDERMSSALYALLTVLYIDSERMICKLGRQVVNYSSKESTLLHNTQLHSGMCIVGTGVGASSSGSKGRVLCLFLGLSRGAYSAWCLLVVETPTGVPFTAVSLNESSSPTSTWH